jgi:hypothetical protein
MATQRRGPRERANYWLTTAAAHLPGIRGRAIFVLGYPRTGTNWMCRIMSEYFDLPLYISEKASGPTLRPPSTICTGSSFPGSEPSTWFGTAATAWSPTTSRS